MAQIRCLLAKMKLFESQQRVNGCIEIGNRLFVSVFCIHSSGMLNLKKNGDT